MSNCFHIDKYDNSLIMHEPSTSFPHNSVQPFSFFFFKSKNQKSEIRISEKPNYRYTQFANTFVRAVICASHEWRL